MRSEAFGTEEDHSNLKMAESLVMPLQYSRADLEAILNDRIALANPSRLSKPLAESTSALESLCGFTRVVHHDRFNSEGDKFSENIFDALIRHTQETPRELIAMAGAIYSINRERRNEYSVKIVVNATAKENITFSIKHSFPGWDDIIHRQFALKIKSQVISERDILALASDFDGHGVLIVKFFMQHGLLGVSERQPQRHKNYYIQQFSFDEVHGDKKSSTVTKDYYFVHPAFKEWIISQPEYMGQKFVRSTLGAIGGGLMYESRLPHIKLGFESGKGFIVFGPTSKEITPISFDSISYPLRFLFICILICRSKRRNEIDMSAVNSILEKIKNNHSKLNALYIPMDTRTSPASIVRDLAKKINMDKNVQIFQRAIKNQGENWENNKKKKTPPFMSIGARSSLGAEIIISIPSLDIDEVDLSNSLRDELGTLR